MAVTGTVESTPTAMAYAAERLASALRQQTLSTGLVDQTQLGGDVARGEAEGRRLLRDRLPSRH